MRFSIESTVPTQQYGNLKPSVTDVEAHEIPSAVQAFNALLTELASQGTPQRAIELEKIAVVANGLGAGTTIVSTPEMQQVAAPLPVASPPPPAVVTPPAAVGGRTCLHGERIQRSGNGAKGPWVGWFCPTPKGTPDQCDVQWN